MTKIVAIAWKDLRSTLRNMPALVMMLVAPLALAGLLGFAFGGEAGSFSISATKVVVVDLDEGGAGGDAAGAALVDAMTSERLREVVDTLVLDEAGAARRLVDEGEADSALIVPERLTATLRGGPVTRPVEIQLYQNPTIELGNSITAGVVEQVLLDFNGARAAAAGALAVVAGGEPSSGAVVGAEAGAVASRAAETFLHEGGASRKLELVQRAPAVSGQERDIGVVGLVLAGMMVFFMFFGASNVARTILDEDRDGTLPRLLTTPTPAGTVLGGKLASVFVTVLAQAVVLLLAGRLLFGIDWGGLAVVVPLTVVTALVAAGLALLVISLVRTPAQAGAIGSGVYLVLALLGGNFTGTATTAGTYARIQEFTPNGWLLRGWDASMRGGGLQDVGWALLIPTLFAAVFFAIAVLRLRRRYA
jgi:ABC-2 type transport system permease protein